MKNPMNCHLASTSNSNHWIYDETKEYWIIKNSLGHHTTLYLRGIHGDYSSMAYSDEIYTARRYYKGGRVSIVYGPYDGMLTSGLNRFSVSWEDRPSSVDSGFMWSWYNTYDCADKLGDLC